MVPLLVEGCVCNFLAFPPFKAFFELFHSLFCHRLAPPANGWRHLLWEEGGFCNFVGTTCYLFRKLSNSGKEFLLASEVEVYLLPILGLVKGPEKIGTIVLTKCLWIFCMNDA